ncbi:LIM/homeobox protein Lhx9-like isoform X2 [Dreissena polymorpha]|uniref:LIM/homeobox protein Lhx9-like isoform X2 n=1 Tax=Dreissena polymorpha TaxID=45954 RepID=UPI0022644618|nr:LIM/homeobox protein Lhx9-like isoform X2 [Dreissena polymorpha]
MVENMAPTLDNNVHYDDVYRHDHDHDMDYLNEAMPDLHGSDVCRYCAACGCRIDDRYFLMAAEKHWHVHCLTCVDCKLNMDNELTCFVRDGNVYCREDYYRRYSIKCCAKCRLGIAANEMVMRARDFVYHVTCFTCCSCNKTLLPGDYFGMRDHVIYCREDYENAVQGLGPGLSPAAGIQSGSPGMMGVDGMEPIPFYPETKRTQKGRPRKRKLAAPENSGYRQMSYLSGDPDPQRDGVVGQDGYLTSGQPRQKRVRTSFKHHQLRAMKSYFQLNHNPDAKDLKQLAQKTGLSKRVLQNARAKYRRHVLKQEQTKSEGGTVTETEFRLSDDEKPDDKTFTEVSNNSSSSLSDMSDIPQSSLPDYDQPTSGLSELFSSTISAIN